MFYIEYSTARFRIGSIKAVQNINSARGMANSVVMFDFRYRIRDMIRM